MCGAGVRAILSIMLSTVRGVFRDGRVELQEAPPRRTARVLVVFLADEDAEAYVAEPGDQARTAPPQPEAASAVAHPAWPRELVDLLMAGPDVLIERDQPSGPERKDLGL